MGEGTGEVLSQTCTDLTCEGSGFLQPRLELFSRLSQPEGLQLCGPARFILAEQDEVSGVGDQDEPVLVPVLAYLIAFGCQPSVVTNGLDFNHTTFRCLAFPRFSLLHLLCSVEAKVGVSAPC